MEEYLEFSGMNSILCECVKKMIIADAGNPVAFMIEFMYQKYPALASLSHGKCGADYFDVLKLDFHKYKEILALKSKGDLNCAISREGEEQVYKAYATYMQEAYGPTSRYTSIAIYGKELI